MLIDVNIILLVIIRVLCAECAHYFLVCKVLATPSATLLSRVFQILRNIANQYVLILLANPRLSCINVFVAKCLNPPTAGGKFAVV